MNDTDMQATFCATLVDEWVRAGLTNAVVSPGSRSTPLALALAARAEIALSVVLDERSASFFALGIARQTKSAVLLLCTSGTAAAEYHAAVVEADLDHVPIIVCTADRPPELHAIGAPQTIVQHGLYGASTRWSCDPGVASPHNIGAWRSIASRCYIASMHSVRGPGPVHLNLPFREPLVGVAEALPRGRSDSRPWHLQAEGFDQLRAVVSRRRGIVVAGANAGTAAAVQRLASALGWPVLADVRSGLRVPHRCTVSFADAMLRSDAVSSALKPEVVLRLGAPWASKVLANFLSEVEVDILVDPFDSWLDPNRTCAYHVSADPDVFCDQLLDALGTDGRVDGSWLRRWRELDDAASEVISHELESHAEPVEPDLARRLLAGLPNGSVLVVSSSMPVRDVEWFGAAREGVVTIANRGANGIDGVVSTIAGAAVGAKSDRDGVHVVGLLGDLSLLHDASGLVSLAALNASETIAVTFVVIDNAGGGIFEFLPQVDAVERDRFELLFGTHQPVDIGRLLSSFGFDVRTVGSVEDAVSGAVEPLSAGVRFVVLNTDRVRNVAVHQQVNAAVNTALRAVLGTDSGPGAEPTPT